MNSRIRKQKFIHLLRKWIRDSITRDVSRTADEATARGDPAPTSQCALTSIVRAHCEVGAAALALIMLTIVIIIMTIMIVIMTLIKLV